MEINKPNELVGLRFHPTDEEIILYYLERKMRGLDFPVHAINEVDFFKYDPWELPAHSALVDDNTWYFFAALSLRPNGNRINRATSSGYWKLTGGAPQIKDQRTNEVIGSRKTLVFYKRRSATTERTSWIMNEFHSNNAPSYQKEFVFCRLKYRKKFDDKPDALRDEPSSYKASGSGNLGAQNIVSRTPAAAEERTPPIHDVEFEKAFLQTVGEVHMMPGLKILTLEETDESTSDTTSLSSEHCVSTSSWDTGEEVEMACPPQTATMPPMLPIYDIETEPSQTEGGQMMAGLDVIVARSVEPAGVKSIERNVQKILRYVSDVTATKIGVHGIGGIGKTTMLKALVRYPTTKSMFDVIILVTVSRYWSTRKIQNEVLRQLSLCHKDSETDSELAERLFQVLSGKKFLLLLDDVWDQIDLGALGIPHPNSENGCKIVMASRKLDVCQHMDMIRMIQVETIGTEEAWDLFSEQVGRIIDLPDIWPFARAIVKGCGGLPLLIIVTGRALAEQNNVSIWEHASRKFSLPSIVGVYLNEYVMQLLMFSFDQLKDHDIKSCFLHFSLFPEDREINIPDFIEYCKQEAILTGTWADAHNKGYDMVDVLVRASLLQVTDDGDSIIMHDLIRDLALGILYSAAEDRWCLLGAEGSQLLLRAYSRLREPLNTGSGSSSRSLRSPESSRFFIPPGNSLLLRAGTGITEPPLKEEWEQAKMIFLMDNNLCSLPEGPYCPKLLTLFLQRNCQLREIPLSFFNFMTSLKVLNLSNTRIKSLPKTLFKLKALQILILRDCECLFMLPSEVGCLKCLEVLDLRGTEINKLPDEIGRLAFLRHLEVSFYGSIDDIEYIKLPGNLISSGIISRLHKLETLSIFVYPGDERWNEDVKSVKTEVSELTKLHSLSFHFPKLEYCKEFLKSRSWKYQLLTKFKFVVGPDAKSITSRVPDHVEFDYNQQNRCLRFVNGEKEPDEIQQILARSTAFYLDHHLGIDSLSNFGVSNINGLKFCIISECPEIKTVLHIPEETSAVFPILDTLSMHHLWNLTCIWKGLVPEGSFAELRTLSLHACPKLEYVFKSSMILSLSKLEQLVVEDCPAIGEIVFDTNEIKDSGSVTLPSLKKLTLHYLPALVNTWRSAWPSLEYISFYDCPELKKIARASKLRHSIIEIKAEKSWWYELEWEDAGLGRLLGNRLTIICEDD